MAVDEAMFLAAVDNPSAGPTLRFYAWSEPTLSLGYFQSVSDVCDRLADLPMVRRLTGGGGIVHDRECTYSLVVPAGRWPCDSLLDVVRGVHGAIGDAVPSLQTAAPTSESDPPFLCFERRSAQDLVHEGGKIVGSAQRSRRGVILQHGSILLERSKAAPHLAGLLELDGTIREEGLPAAIQREIAGRWGWTFDSAPLTGDEAQIAQTLDSEKYRSDSWNRRR